MLAKMKSSTLLRCVLMLFITRYATAYYNGDCLGVCVNDCHSLNDGISLFRQDHDLSCKDGHHACCKEFCMHFKDALCASSCFEHNSYAHEIEPHKQPYVEDKSLKCFDYQEHAVCCRKGCAFAGGKCTFDDGHASCHHAHPHTVHAPQFTCGSRFFKCCRPDCLHAGGKCTPEHEPCHAAYKKAPKYSCTDHRCKCCLPHSGPY